MKIDQLLELYLEDRKRLLALPFWQEPEPTKEKFNHPVSTVLKPKPILVDKQSSEPSSPITRNFKEPPVVSVTRRPMHRGFSDLGNRIKKKVTLRYYTFKLLLNFVNNFSIIQFTVRRRSGNRSTNIGSTTTNFWFNQWSNHIGIRA